MPADAGLYASLVVLSAILLVGVLGYHAGWVRGEAVGYARGHDEGYDAGYDDGCRATGRDPLATVPLEDLDG